MEISKMLTLSTAHLRPCTREALTESSLCDMVNSALDWLPVYSKSNGGEEYGWFAYINDIDEPQIRELRDSYEDLYDCIRFAQKHDCEIICFDRDAEELPDLPTYMED